MTAWPAAGCVFLVLVAGGTAAAQTGGEARGSETQIGASFVGNSGNARTTTVGADFSMKYSNAPWKFESSFNAIRVSGRDAPGVERYLEGARVGHRLSSRVGITAGEKLEHDPLAGMDFRSIVDGGLDWKFVQQPSWTLDGITAIAWNHERPAVQSGVNTIKRDANQPIGFFQLLSKVSIGKSSAFTQRVTAYPNLQDRGLARYEGEVSAQASMSDRLALKLGYLVRYTRRPIARFGSTDGTATASVVLKWKTTEAAKTP